MFKVAIAMKPVGEFSTFPEAFKKFYEEFEVIGKAGASRMVLEQACWIECPAGNTDFPLSGPLYIHQLAPLANALHYVDDAGKLVDPLPVVPEEVLRNVTGGLALGVLESEINTAARVLEALDAGTPFTG